MINSVLWCCDKKCDVVKYLDSKDCKCRNRLICKLVEKRNENERLITTDTISITNKKLSCKYSCLIYITVLIVLCLKLMAIIFISCFIITKNIGFRKEEYSISY